MKRLLLTVALLTVSSSSVLSAAARPPVTQHSSGTVKYASHAYRTGVYDEAYLSGTFHVGSKVWSGELRGAHATGDPDGLVLRGSSPFGPVVGQPCVDEVPKTGPSTGTITCLVSVNGAQVRPLVLAVAITAPYDPSSSYGGYQLMGTFVGS
jgi:opacity protein-like surface antigen